MLKFYLFKNRFTHWLATYWVCTWNLLLQASTFLYFFKFLYLTCFYSYITRQAQHHHPYLATCYLQPYQTPSSIELSAQQHECFTHNALVPANPLLNVPVPKWLKIYTKSSSEKDYIIKWNMFQVHQLVYINEMIAKLFKEEIQMIVLKYESLRYKSII